MNDGTDTLRARLNKHAAEITTLDERHRKLVRFWKGLFLTTLAWGILGFSIAIYLKLSAPPPSTWHTDAPPADQRIQMVVYVYKGADGMWKSYAEGHPVEPVTSATGQMLWHP